MTSQSNASTPVQVPFHGDTLEAARAEDGKILVSPLRVCEALGLNWRTQQRKLESCSWSTMVKMTMVAQDGKQRQLTMIPLKIVPMWLAGISVNKVKPGLRAKLLAYQLEVVEVLSAWFLGVSDIAGLADEMAEIKARLSKLEAEKANAERSLGIEKTRSMLHLGIAEDFAKQLDMVLMPLQEGDGEHMTLREFCDEYEVFGVSGRRLTSNALKRAGRALAALCEDIGIPPRKSKRGMILVNSYRIDVLQIWRAQHEVWNRASVKAYSRFFMIPSIV